MNILTQAFTFLHNFHIQILIAEFMFGLHLKRKRNIVLIIAGILLYSMLPYLFPQSYFWSGVRIGSWFTFGFLIMLFLSLLLFWFIFNVSSLKELVFYGVAACILQHLIHDFRMLYALIFHKTTGVYSLDYNTDNIFPTIFIQLLISIVLYDLFYLIFVQRYTRDEIIGVRNVYLIVFTMFSIFIVYFLHLWTSTEETVTIGVLVFDAFCCILLLLLQFGMFEWSRLQKENVIMQQILHLQKQQHKMSRENIELINIKCHDLKHQISALRRLTTPEEMEESIREIERAIMIYDLSIKTGNEALDIVLAEKSLYCEKHDIKLSCIADGSKLNFMNSADVYSLFANALDNAIESVCKIENKEKRVISLNISCRGNLLVINMSNYYEEPLLFKDGLPLTTKKNKDYHGYGIKSIRYITERYGGTMSIQSENNIFKLNILFPL